jgi:cold shock CspA family protein
MTTITAAGAIFASARFDKPLRDHLWSLSAPRRTNQSKKDSSPMHYGTVSRWNNLRAYGFIQADSHVDGISADKEVFVHIKSLPRGVEALIPGTRVEWHPKPPRAAGKPVEAKIIRVLDMAEAA